MSEPSYEELKKAFPDGSMIRFKERRNEHQAISEELEGWMKELGVTLTEHDCDKCSIKYKSINPEPKQKLCLDCWLDLDDSEVFC
jgi:hypothetical protein